MPRWLASVVGALIPEPYRSQLVARHGGDPPRASMLLGVVEFVAGAAWVHDDALACFHRAAEAMTAEFARIASARDVSTVDAFALTWGGAVVWLAWIADPRTWALMSIPLVGLTRAASYLGPREAVAEPSVWLMTRLLELGSRFGAAVRERAAFGESQAADEVLVEDDAILVVHTARPRPEWNELVTIAVGERFFRVAARDETVRAGLRRHRYRLVEAGEHEVIRRLLRYVPPPA